MKKKVLITVDGNCPYIPEMLDMLHAEGIETKQADLTRVDLDGLKEQAADCASVIACAETYNDAVFDGLPNLKCIVKSGVGLDAIDLNAATRHGVVVSNTPGANGDAVAEMAATMILSALRRTVYYNSCVADGIWQSDAYSHELSTRTIGLIGFGYIAQKLVIFLSGFGCRFLAYDIFPNYEKGMQLGVEFTDIDTIYAQSDIISLHAPLTEQTRHLINRQSLAKMKPTAILINTSRGGVIDEEALYEALRDKTIAAAALDVTATEPLPVDSPLRALKNIQFTPHTATATYEAMKNLYTACAVQTIQFYRGEPINHTVNPDYIKYL